MKCAFIIFACALHLVHSRPAEDAALVISTEATTIADGDAQTPTTVSEKDLQTLRPPKISELDIESNVTNRFATTSVRSKVKNEAPIAQETTFFIIIPDHAFISSFVMELAGKNYSAYVEEKKKAQQTYNDAVTAGIGAAHVAQSARDSNKFEVSVNIEPASKAIFYLVYEELLERKDGLYEQVINIHPNQLVPVMHVQVDIDESRPITELKTPPIRSGNEIAKQSPNLDPQAHVERLEPNKARVTFDPDHEQQKRIAAGLGKEEDQGIAGQFVVQYDVERDPHGGEVLVKDGYFVHFFAPKDVQPLDKHVVFVLDTSGSMYDRKMDQLKEAMHNILNELRPKDLFNLVEFNTNVKVWHLDAPTESTYFPYSEDNWYNHNQVFDLTDVSFPPAYPVNKDTVKKANKAVDDMYATGGTNIYEALRVGLHLIKLRQTRTGDKNVQPLIVFLTDGDPTVGKTSTTEIISGIAEQNIAHVPIISLSFGTGADREFLQKISLKNTGFARHIYEDSDASLQLQNFYKQISSPLLHNIKFEYTPDITSLTRQEFPILYGGGEIVVCGTYPRTADFPEKAAKVESWGRTGPLNLLPSVAKATGQLERLWAYMTVKKYLDAKDAAPEGSKGTSEYETKALDLAKKYSFVTPVTSLVVVKPNSTRAINAEAADRGESYPSQFLSAQFPVSGLSGAPQGVMYSMAMPATPLGIAGPSGFGGGGFAKFGMHPSLPAPPQPYNPNGSGAIPQAEAEEDVLDSADYDKIVSYPTTYVDRIIGSEPSTTPATTTSTTTTTPQPVTLPPNLADKLPWLAEHLRPDGTLSFFKGNFHLGFNATSPTQDNECTDSKSVEGRCVLLQDCSELFPVLTSPKEFKDHFCSIEGKYAGVCCSAKIAPSSTPSSTTTTTKKYEAPAPAPAAKPSST